MSSLVNVWGECSALMEKYDEFIPASGKCNTVKGEIARAVNRIVYRFFNDGDKAGEGYGRETVNAAVRYLNEQVNTIPGRMLQVCVDNCYCMFNDDRYAEILLELCTIISEILDNGDYDYENKEDMWDYRTAEDEEWEPVTDDEDDYYDEHFEDDVVYEEPYDEF